MADSINLSAKDVMSNLGKSGAYERHRETRAMRAEVFMWCNSNRDSFKKNAKGTYKLDPIAHAASDAKLVPAVWRTIRKWVGEWAQTQSAGRL